MKWIDAAALHMRRPGNFSYVDSYQPNTAPPTGRRAGGRNSIQYVRASNVQGRYNKGSEAFSSLNPDYFELSWMSTSEQDLYRDPSRDWDTIIAWNHIFCGDPFGVNHAPGWINNTRSQWWDWQIWIKKKSTGQWVEIGKSDEWGGVPVSPNFVFEDYSYTWQDFRTESNGYQSARLMYDPNAPYANEGVTYWAYHGFAVKRRFPDFGVSMDDVADVVISAKHSLVIHNPTLKDDRDFTRYSLAIGADWYGNPKAPGNPGLGTSYHKFATAKWPQFEYCIYHTTVEASIRSSYPSVFLNASDSLGEGSVLPPDPDPENPPPEPPGPAPTRGNWFAVLSSGVGNWQPATAPTGDTVPAWGQSVRLLPVAGVAFSYQAAVASGSPAPTYSKVSGPSWASVSSGGLVTGTPTVAGVDTPLVIRATNSAGTTDETFLIEVLAAAVAPNITTTTLPAAIFGALYNQIIGITGGEPITLALHAGTLPTGLSLVGRSITGTPTNAAQAGTFNITLRATNAGGTDDQALTLLYSAASEAPVVTTTSLAAGTVGTAYSQTLTATGATPITWSVTGALPPGLSRSGASISGTPTAPGAWQITATATNAFGSASRVLTISAVAAAQVARRTSPWAKWLKR